jgi:hypothetical protein
VYTRVHTYLTRVYVLKHLKKYKTPYFRAERVLPADHLLVPVAPTIPNQFLTKKLLWNWYKKTSKGRPKGGEIIEQGYYTEFFPPDQV